MIEKIEKFTQFSLSQNKSAQSEATLQSCYFNLKNLQKIVGQTSTINGHSKRELFFDQAKLIRSSYTQCTLPQISIIKPNNKFANSNAFLQSSFRSTELLKTSFSNEPNSIEPKNSQLFLMSQNINRLIKKNNSEKFLKTNQNKKFMSSKIVNDNMISNMKKRNKINSSQNNMRKCPKIILGLAKNQRFFQEKQVDISQQTVQKIGLYQATNLYKQKNICKFLSKGYEDKLKPVINLKFATFTLCNRNQFFLTSNSEMPQYYQADPYLQIAAKQQQQKQKSNILQTQTKNGEIQNDKIKEYQNLVQNNDKEFISSKSCIQNPKNQWYILKVQNYNFVKNQQYYAFKKANIEDWNQISFILYKITQYLQKIKISLFSFKFQKDIFMEQLWSCRKINENKLQKLLNLVVKNYEKQKNGQQNQIKINRIYKNRAEVIKQLVRLWRDRKNLQIIRKQKKKQKDMLVWISLRMVAKRKIKLAKKKAIARVEVLNNKLRNGDWDYQIEIHIPSFSQSEEVRNTTQYMQYYENMYFHMWKSSNKHFVLILPAINETILEMFQQKIKLSKNITLICPESHEQYPKSLPLSACLLYSKQGLNRIKRVLDGKKGIIIPGRRSSNQFMYQYYLSQLLNCPILSNLNAPTLLGDMKKLWQKYQLPTVIYKILQPKSSIQKVINSLSELIVQYQSTKKWVFKMNREFNGRGIATFDAESSKKIKQILQIQKHYEKQGENENFSFKCKHRIKQEMKQSIKLYLQTHFRLKLRVNFENCIFRVQEYIQKLLQKGGIIEQHVQDCDTYEFCYKIQPGETNFSQLYILDQLQEERHIACCQNIQVDFVTKLSIFSHNQLPYALKNFSRQAQKILKQQKHLGFVSVTVLFDPKNSQIYAIESKPYMTINSSISYFIKIFTKKGKQVTNRRNANLVSSKQYQFSSKKELTSNRDHGDGLIYLLIPVIIFTDVNEITRSQIIQNLVMTSWQKTSPQLFNQPIVSTNSDIFHGNLFLSLGLSLSLLIYGKSYQMKKMKKQASDIIRDLSEKIQPIKLYIGKQQTRDVFQFGDLIRAITKIK